MVLRAQWPLGAIAQFFHFVAEEKKNDQKTKAFYDWATTGIPVITRDMRDLWVSSECFYSFLLHHPIIRYHSMGNY